MSKQLNLRPSDELVDCILAYAKMNGTSVVSTASKLLTEALTTHVGEGLWNDQQRGRQMRLAWRALLAKQEK